MPGPEDTVTDIVVVRCVDGPVPVVGVDVSVGGTVLVPAVVVAGLVGPVDDERQVYPQSLGSVTGRHESEGSQQGFH